MRAMILTSPMHGWACPLDDVPDPVFAGRMLGDGVAIDPTEGLLCAPCDGEILTVHASRHAVTMRGGGGVELLMHIGVDTVALAGAGFEALVAPGAQVDRGQPLIRFDLDAVARTVPSLMTPLIVTSGDRFAIRPATTGEGASVALGDALLHLEPRDPADQRMSAPDGARVSRRIRVPLVHGIHARPAARIGDVARAHTSDSWIARAGVEATTRSPIALLQLGIGHDDEVEVIAAGPDAQATVAALCDLIAGGMGELPGQADTPAAPVAPAMVRADIPTGALAGTMAAQGYCVGTARWLRASDIDVPHDGAGVAIETARLDGAIARMRDRLAGDGAQDTRAAIRAAHLAFLDDPALRDDAARHLREGRDAAHAWRAACRAMAATMRMIGDARLAERADDLVDLERQLVHMLMGVEPQHLHFPPGTILLADELLPSQVMALDANVVGIALERGGPTSHVAILAASMGLPAVVAIGAPLGDVADGTALILDADAGLLHVDPAADALAAARAQVDRRASARAAAVAAAVAPCVSRDGVRIEAFANLGSLADAQVAIDHGAEGSGLLRTEFLFLDRDAAPDVAEQAELYGAIAARLDGRPLIIRLLDIGGDKPAPYLPIAAEENPALGLRGIRVGLARPDMLDAQLRAILSVRPLGQCHIMIPMVASVGELLAVRHRVAAICRDLGHDNVVPVGIMVETPAAAVTAATLARHADFLSIGTNDLTQYTLAMDRGNAAVAAGIDGLHPAVLGLIAQTCAGAARHDRWVGVCGGLASDRLAIPLLLGLGVTELSAAPQFVPDLKALVRRLSVADCRVHAAQALALESAADVRALARRFEQDLPQ